MKKVERKRGRKSMEVLRKNDNIIELVNNDLVIEYDNDTIQEAARDELLIFSDVIGWLDTNIIGDAFCLSNYEMGIMLYNGYSDKCYIVSFTDLEKIKAGEKVTLHAYDPDEDDREAIEREYA
jgi:hypothetical protein